MAGDGTVESWPELIKPAASLLFVDAFRKPPFRSKKNAGDHFEAFAGEVRRAARG
jgi:hypothetical protein